ncbi:MAG: hypothetical protein WCK32_04460 [Chlorobiaceae bacterium]
MALITCPDCKKRFSETADCCPKCGCKLTLVQVNDIRTREKKRKKIAYILCSVLAIIFMITSLSHCGNRAPAVVEEGTAVDRGLLYEQAEKAVKEANGDVKEQPLELSFNAIHAVNTFTVQGKTNLPDMTKLGISLWHPGFAGSTTAIVQRGEFHCEFDIRNTQSYEEYVDECVSHGYSKEKAESLYYNNLGWKVMLSLPSSELQPETVQRVVGKEYKYFTSEDFDVLPGSRYKSYSITKIFN